jgi:hypothetical protein
MNLELGGSIEQARRRSGRCPGVTARVELITTVAPFARKQAVSASCLE